MVSHCEDGGSDRQQTESSGEIAQGSGTHAAPFPRNQTGKIRRENDEY
jgi:hypothetical protein